MNHSRIFLASLLNGSASSNRAALTAVRRSSGVDGPRLLCAQEDGMDIRTAVPNRAAFIRSLIAISTPGSASLAHRRQFVHKLDMAAHGAIDALDLWILRLDQVVF